MLLPMFVHTLLATTGSGVVGPMLMRDPPLFLGNDLLVTCIMVMFVLAVVFDPYIINFLKKVSNGTTPRTSVSCCVASLLHHRCFLAKYTCSTQLFFLADVSTVRTM